MPLILSGDTGVPASGMPTGSVIQTVIGNTSTQTPNTNSTYVASTLTASITPTSTSSRILVLVNGYVRTSTTQVSIGYTVYRNNTTDIFTIPTSGGGYIYTSAGGAFEGVISLNGIDSPATTSSTSYTVYFKRMDAAGTAYYGVPNFSSTITLLEIR